ncbi:MAG: hypothetical protein V3W41_11755 [Planctomycetota bacterium]
MRPQDQKPKFDQSESVLQELGQASQANSKDKAALIAVAKHYGPEMELTEEVACELISAITLDFLGESLGEELEAELLRSAAAKIMAHKGGRARLERLWKSLQSRDPQGDSQ